MTIIPICQFGIMCRRFSRLIRPMSTLCPTGNSERSRKFTVAVEGNIGSGKTTLLKHFDARPDAEVYMEPVEKWRDIQGHNGLKLMYEDASRWSLTFQTYVQLTMLQQHTQPQTKRVKLMERSIHSAKYCFVENLRRSGKMPDVEYVVLTKWFDWILANERVDVDLIVYLRTRPETVYERIQKRCRKEESRVSMDYLERLHGLHEDWLIHEKLGRLGSNLLVIDGNHDTDSMLKVYEQFSRKILCEDSLEPEPHVHKHFAHGVS